MQNNTYENREIALNRLLEDLEDAYGSTIRKARKDFLCTDINVNEDGSIWTNAGGKYEFTGEYLSAGAARRIVNLVADIDGQSIVKASVNANLPTGERFAALLPPTVKGIMISIRLPPRRIYTLVEYVSAGIMTDEQAEILRRAAEDRLDILIGGGTGAGKSTLANALLAEPPYVESRTCIIQDQNELQISGANKNRAFTNVMTPRELIKEFLRHNPDRIVVGEIRDGETAAEWIGASNTGHPGGLSTIHCNSAQRALARIASLIGNVAVNVPHEEIVDGIGIIAFIRKERDGSRKLVEILKPVSHDGKRYVMEPAKLD